MVIPANNAALSLFQSMTMQINDTPVTTSPENYHYRSYLQSLVSYDDNAKASNLYLNGWLTDDCELDSGVSTIEPSSSNESQLARNAWFRQGLKITTGATSEPYSSEGFTFIT